MTSFYLPYSNAKPTRLTDDDVLSFALRSGWIDDIGVIDPTSTIMERRPLDWWPGCDLITASDPIWGPTMAAWVLKDGGRLVRLDGTSPPIHMLNQAMDPILNRNNAIAYLGFFCTFVHAEAGPFATIGALEDQILPLELDREKIAGFIRAPQILKEEPIAEDEGKISYHIETLVYYGDALFISNFLLKPTGMVDMLEDEPLAADLGATIAMKLKFKDPENTEGSTAANHDEAVH